MSSYEQPNTPADLHAARVPRAIRREPVVRDRLTILRMLVIVTTIAIGVAVYGPERSKFDPEKIESWRFFYTSLLLGMSLAGPMFALVRRRNYRLGAGGLLALTLGLGALVMMPPAIMMRSRNGSVENSTAFFCLYYCMPLMTLWYLAAMAAGGRLSRRSLSRVAPWSERYGLILALLWSPLGLWLLWEVYCEAF